jgi:hypothetical protein
MKSKFMLCICFVWLCMANSNAQSCCAGGSCCCTAGGGNSILPDLDKHIVGINYSYSQYNTTTTPNVNMIMNGAEMVMPGPTVATRGTVNTIQAYGRFNLPKRFQISVSVPVHFLQEASSEATDRSAGLGDVSVMGFYSIFDPKKSASKKSRHQIRVGLGVKTPTGKFSMADGVFTSDLVLGTGSVDFIFNINYIYRFGKFGVSVSPMYKKNLANKDDYRFGDIAGSDLNGFYVVTLPKGFTITPKVGAKYNYMFHNVYDKEVQGMTGSNVLRANAGMDIYYHHFVLSASVAPVVFCANNSSMEPIPVLSFETGLYYSF